MCATIETKKYECTVSESWYASLERAYISIKTPKGTILTISKWPKHSLINKWDKNEEAAKLVWRVYSEIVTNESKIKVVYLTRDEIILWESVCDDQGKRDPNRPESKPKKECYHKFKKEKDHGSWVGWFFPSCGAGGSYNKKTTNFKRR